MHDPRIGRFFAVDPLSPKYPHNSPYAFSENVVINAVELEGLERKYTYAKIGTYWNGDEYIMDIKVKVELDESVHKALQALNLGVHHIYYYNENGDFIGYDERTTPMSYSITDELTGESTTVKSHMWFTYMDGEAESYITDFVMNSGWSNAYFRAGTMQNIAETDMGYNYGVQNLDVLLSTSVMGVLPKGAPKPFTNKLSTVEVTGKKINGNSRKSLNSQHGYEVYNVRTGEVVKTGISGGRISKKTGLSYRAQRQVRKWNRKEGAGTYESRIVYQNNGGKGARDRALFWEAGNAEFWRSRGHLRDPKKHSRP